MRVCVCAGICITLNTSGRRIPVNSGFGSPDDILPYPRDLLLSYFDRHPTPHDPRWLLHSAGGAAEKTLVVDLLPPAWKLLTKVIFVSTARGSRDSHMLA